MPEFNYLGGEWFPAREGVYFLSHVIGKTTINLFDLRSEQTRLIFALDNLRLDGSAECRFQEMAGLCSTRKWIPLRAT
jgi:hypothetical protein